jgi:hypothetical protein
MSRAFKVTAICTLHYKLPYFVTNIRHDISYDEFTLVEDIGGSTVKIITFPHGITSALHRHHFRKARPI